MQKKLTVLFAFAIFVLVVGWAITPAQAHCKKKGPHAEHCNGGNGNGDDGGGGPIRVTVNFRDFQDVNDPPPDRMMSDCHETQGYCPYIDKKNKVVALIRSTTQGKGNFVMHLSKFRTLFLDFRDCPSGMGTCLPPFEADFTVVATSIFTSGIDLTTMEVGDFFPNLSMGIYLNSIEDSGVWSLFFGPNDENCQGSTPIGVKRMGTDTWVIEAGGMNGSGSRGCLGEGVGGGELAFRGLYVMPFEITVQKK